MSVVFVVFVVLFSNAQADVKWPTIVSYSLDSPRFANSWWRGTYTVSWTTIYIPEAIRNQVPNGGNMSAFGARYIVPVNPQFKGGNLPPYVDATCRPNCTWGDLSDLFYEKYAESGTITTNVEFSSVTSDIFSGMPYLACLGGTRYNQARDDPPIAPMAGLNDCLAVLSESYTSCSFVDSQLEFDFGRMITSHASGQSMNKSIDVECIKDPSDQYAVSYKLFSIKGSEISLGNGMTAKLSINGIGFSDFKQTISDGIFPLILSVFLEGTPTSSGPFGGESVIVMTYN